MPEKFNFSPDEIPAEEKVSIEPEVFKKAEEERKEKFPQTPEEISQELDAKSKAAKKLAPLPLGSEKEQFLDEPEAKEIEKSLKEVGKELREREQQRIISRVAEELRGSELPTKEPEFLDFLMRYPDMALEMGADFSKKIKNRYETYAAQKELGKKIEGFYAKELPEKFAVKLDKNDRGALKKAMTEMAIENPEKAKESLAEWNHHEKQKEFIEILEKQVTELGGEKERKKAVAELEKEEKAWAQKKEIAEWTTGWRGFLNPKNSELLGWFFQSRIFGETKEKREYRQEIQKKAGIKWRLPFFKIKNVEEDINKITEEYEKAKRLKRTLMGAAPEQLQRLKTMFGDWRKQFLENFEGARTITRLASAKINQKINALVSKGMVEKDVDKLEEAQLYANLIKRGVEESNIQIEFGLKQGAVKRKVGPEKFVDLIDKKVEKLTTAVIQEKIAGLNLPKSSIESLYSALKTLLEKPTLGAKTKIQAKTFIQNTLLDNIKKMERQTGKRLESIQKQLRQLEGSKKPIDITGMKLLREEQRRIQKDKQKKFILLNITVAKIAATT